VRVKGFFQIISQLMYKKIGYEEEEEADAYREKKQRASDGLLTDSLKDRIHELEQDGANRGGDFKYIVCLSSHETPLSSFTCWHFHCKDCWIRSLSVKRVCPQCQVITSPAKLRQIYL
jgi:hypothetical protein